MDYHADLESGGSGVLNLDCHSGTVMAGTLESSAAIEHDGEVRSNELRRQLLDVEPISSRTRTPSLAVLAKSAGSYHWTPEGRKLADFTSGVLVANLGHNPHRWWQRVHKNLGLDAMHASVGTQDAEQIDGFVSAVPLTAYNAVTEIELQATDRLIRNLQHQPGGDRCQQVLWAASGSEAIQKALWACMARRPGQNMILATRGGFHGKKGLAGAVTGSENDRERDPRVRFISFPMEECSSVARREQKLDLKHYRLELDAIWEELGSKICCLITEPYLGGGGSYHPQKEYLQLLQEFCREHDIVFILDEVQSNFGRTGSMYAFTTYGVEPDIVCLGKGLGNGVPVAAAAGRSDIFASLTYGEGSDTWSANPLSAAAVVATLDEFEQTDVLRHAEQLAKAIKDSLLKIGTLPAIANIRGEGTVWGVECASVGSRTAAQVASDIVEACYRGDSQGRAIHLLGPLASKVLRVSPPLVMPIDEAKEYFQAMYDIVESIGRA